MFSSETATPVNFNMQHIFSMCGQFNCVSVVIFITKRVELKSLVVCN